MFPVGAVMTIMKTSWVVPFGYAHILRSHEALPQWELQQGIVAWNGITLVNSTDPTAPVIDANLAVALDALLAEQSVTRAAARMRTSPRP